MSMLKVDVLRQQLNQAVPWLRDNPENLWMGVRKGALVATGQESAFFEYRYHLEIIVLDYPGDIDRLSLAILTWAKVHQPDLIFNPDKRVREVSFSADILSNNCADILFGLPVDEVRLVSRDAQGRPVITARDEPDYAEMMGLDATGWDVDFKDNLNTLSAGADNE